MVVSVCDPAPGRFSGHEPKLLPWTSSEREMSLTPWPPVWLPEMPVNSRSISEAP